MRMKYIKDLNRDPNLPHLNAIADSASQYRETLMVREIKEWQFIAMRRTREALKSEQNGEDGPQMVNKENLK